ncbi:L-asparaginase-like isoform X1 [Alosa sapidissima]|uniref:L-asparaginase-like isoform X1 n=1 Tax=Alosa sapidissima TaxID=34773 RepID=UPI001C0A48EE|nr:L-asparaginase-like isoform X1 [Alosa sapidissima]XP_041931485.1 L-asparaginase-like isoform X1 [Alosa sapidissima]XP_041931486.1 L-asparaginase-like isoform X1 [Alosa sapidissima]
MENDPLVFVTNIQVLGAKTRNRDFLFWLGELLKLNWLKKNNPEVKGDIIPKLIIAFACECVEINDFVSLQELLERVDIDTAGYDGSSPIHRACEKGNVGMLKYLLSKGASCNLSDRNGNTPMTLAIKKRHLDTVMQLQKFGGSIYLDSVRIGMELNKAVLDRDYLMLKAWHHAGVDMDQADYNGRTAMHTAVRNRDPGMVSKLLEYGATPLELDVWGWTAVDEAKKHHLTDILMLFHPLFTEKFTNSHLYQLYKESLEAGLE